MLISLSTIVIKIYIGAWKSHLILTLLGKTGATCRKKAGEFVGNPSKIWSKTPTLVTDVFSGTPSLANNLEEYFKVGVVIPPAGPPITLPLGWLLPGGQVAGIKSNLFCFFKLKLLLCLEE